MTRSALDRLLSSAGLIIAIALLIGSIALFWTHNFIHSQVHDQLASEKIYFPEAGTDSITSLPPADQSQVSQYAGQELLTGDQAEVFANHYIAVHLTKIGGGKTYSELSAASLAAPTNTALAAQVQTVFQGETLRGMLLNAYAFDTASLIAFYAAIGALVTGILLVGLAILGFIHAGTAKVKKRRQRK